MKRTKWKMNWRKGEMGENEVVCFYKQVTCCSGIFSILSDCTPITNRREQGLQEAIYFSISFPPYLISSSTNLCTKVKGDF
jgi:hypothetical protein